MSNNEPDIQSEPAPADDGTRPEPGPEPTPREQHTMFRDTFKRIRRFSAQVRADLQLDVWLVCPRCKHAVVPFIQGEDTKVVCDCQEWTVRG